ncbi:patatin-like phospholipase family protein [Spiractinospora alimapuensis]|uniref:patatin-like phospholipase family protein n=1 Tax=Spiractinospora alimapuensis TaxID=2820884 RepID=UPI001F351718|nr:patatin-like phospholipase family protein [Spiractinospora alimapuensis]QVQ51940.1 patatin-like phospholipase family protein [Spiractinospora alimapuensis]
MSVDAQHHGGTAFVLGGGGALGAYEVGMLRALAEAGIAPDLVVGTSVGAINGASLAADPTSAVRRMSEWWRSGVIGHVFSGSLLRRVTTLARTGTALHSHHELRRLLTNSLPVDRIEDLQVPFQCVAASVERASAHWFTHGPLVDAVLASSSVPGVLPPVEIDGVHYYDGGLVHSIPVGRAVRLGATRIYVLHVGRIERPLAVPRWPWEVGLVAFEIARRHRFTEEIATLPPDVEVHVLPTGADPRAEPSQLRYRASGNIGDRIERAYRASTEYLESSISRA